MKKILLMLVILAMSGYTYKTMAQCDPSQPVKKYTANANPAPFAIDGSAADWIAAINGPFSGNNFSPYATPVAAGNIQIDGLRAGVGTDDDRDNPGQDHRDLRFFSFTYDQKNVYFYYRRPDNNTAQVLFIYYVDINADGYMRNGEPVVVVGLQGPNANIAMHYYNENVSSLGHDAVKGDVMVNPNPGPGFGLADGYAMPGTISAAVTPPTLQSGELFAAAKTESGYEVNL